MASLWAWVQTHTPAVVVFGVPLALLTFVELYTACLDSLVILTQLKFDLPHC
jgi:hypothetical protein